MTGDIDGREGRVWLEHEKRPGVSAIRSLMIRESAPVDENGHPYQVLIEYDEHNEALGLVRDEAGRPLTWILTPDGISDVRDHEGRAALRPGSARGRAGCGRVVGRRARRRGRALTSPP